MSLITCRALGKSVRGAALSVRDPYHSVEEWYRILMWNVSDHLWPNLSIGLRERVLSVQSVLHPEPDLAMQGQREGDLVVSDVEARDSER